MTVPPPISPGQQRAARHAQRSWWQLLRTDARRFVFGPRRLSLFGRLGIVAMCLVCFGLYVEIGNASEEAYRRSVTDNQPLCAAAQLIAYPPPGSQPETEYGRTLSEAMRRFVESPDCP